jgi:hypothetical protein
VKPQPCAAFVVVLILFGFVPVMGNMWVNVVVAWALAFVAFAVVDDRMERNKRGSHRR